MKVKNLLLFVFAWSTVAIMPALGQVVDTTGLGNNPVFTDPDLSNMLNAYHLIFGSLVVIWGFVAKGFGLKSKMKNNFVFVVLAGAVVIGGVFVTAGWSSAVSLLFPFLGAIGFYDLIFKPGQQLLQSFQKSSE
jgi:hypothetical protein